jgi:membrane associated rhomboid family serine protease
LVAILVPFWIAHTRISAAVLIGIWFVLQLIGGVGSIAATTGGVAYFAHIGGFIAGVVLIKLFGVGRRTTGEYDVRQQRG